MDQQVLDDLGVLENQDLPKDKHCHDYDLLSKANLDDRYQDEMVETDRGLDRQTGRQTDNEKTHRSSWSSRCSSRTSITL